MSKRPVRKRFGQNFLHDARIIQRIVEVIAPNDSDHFVEIGPGTGAITKPLSAACARLDVIEIDRDLADDLESLEWATAINIHRADALSFDFSQLTDKPAGLRLAGNLPYNISTPLLFHILSQHECFEDVHVMLQREVVQRMTAQPGSKIYGRLSVALAARCHVESLLVIKAGAFQPAPKVQSAFARLTPLREPLISRDDESTFDSIVRGAFGQRRKQLRNALQGIMTPEQIRSADIDPQTRAEQLDVGQYVALTHSLLSTKS